MYEDGEPVRIAHPEGFVQVVTDPDGERSYSYHYTHTDHLGSVRAVRQADSLGMMTVQQTDYYPFGLSFAYNDLHKNKFLFSGKELLDADAKDDGRMLMLYDFGARLYDPLIGRWGHWIRWRKSITPSLLMCIALIIP